MVQLHCACYHKATFSSVIVLTSVGRPVVPGPCYACRGDVPETVCEYARGLGGYRKNTFSTLDPELKQRVAEEWADSFKEFGYKI